MIRQALLASALLAGMPTVQAGVPARKQPSQTPAATGVGPDASAALNKLEPKHMPPLPPKVEEIANQLFVEASAAAAAGDHDAAIHKYRELQSLASHPHISFNIAMALEAKGDYRNAIQEYQAYLPTAVGGEAVAIATRISQLSATPAPVIAVATTDFKVKSLWFVDGVLRGRDACKFDVAPGRHKIENVSEIGYWSARLLTEPGPNGGKRLRHKVDTRHDGNIIISAPANDNWSWFFAIDGSDRDDVLGKGPHYSGRYNVADGKHQLVAKDAVCQYTLEFTVAKDQLVYFYLLREGYDKKALLKDMGPNKPACGRIVGVPIVIDFDAKVPGRLQTPNAKK